VGATQRRSRWKGSDSVLPSRERFSTCCGLTRELTPLSNILVLVAVAAVFLVLVAGFINMFRGGGGAPERSQILMRWRVGLQFLALAIVLAVLYFRGH
jgi:hypothetical protein